MNGYFEQCWPDSWTRGMHMRLSKRKVAPINGIGVCGSPFRLARGWGRYGGGFTRAHDCNTHTHTRLFDLLGKSSALPTGSWTGRKFGCHISTIWLKISCLAHTSNRLILPTVMRLLTTSIGLPTYVKLYGEGSNLCAKRRKVHEDADQKCKTLASKRSQLLQGRQG